MGALLKVLNELKITNKYDVKYFVEIFSSIKSDGKLLFSRDGDFAGTGGFGLQSKLYKKIIELISYKRGIVGKRLGSGVILDMKKVFFHDKFYNDLYISDGTTMRLSNQEIDNIRSS